jgi:outer membrane protein
MKRRNLQVAIRLSGALVGFWASTLVAQQAPQRLTLDEAQRLATLNNPQFRSVQNDVLVAEANVRQSYGRFLPSVDAGLGFSGSNSSTLTATDDFGRPIEGARRVETERSSASQGIGLNFTLFDGGRNLRGVSSAKAELRATEARVAREANRLRAQVAREYFGALRLEQQIELEQRVLAARRDDLERTQKLLAVAATKYVDVLSARVQVAEAEQLVDRTRGDAEKARLLLKQTMGVEGAAAFALSSPVPEAFDPSALDVEALVGTALNASPAIGERTAAVAAADKRTTDAKASRWPSIIGGVNLGRGTNASGYNAFGELNPANRFWDFSVRLNLPIFSQFTTSYSIAQADAAASDARESLRQERLTVEREVRAAYIDLGNAYRNARLAEQKREISMERLAAAQEEYRLGGIDFFRLQNYANEAASADRQLLEARFNFVVAMIALEEKVGAPVER